MGKISYIIALSSAYRLLTNLAFAEDTGQTTSNTSVTVIKNTTNVTNVGTCEPVITMTIWGGLLLVTALVFGIGYFVITPSLERKAITENPNDPESHVKSAQMKGMGVTSILTALTLLVVSFLLLGCIPVPMMIFIVVIFMVIFGYGALLM